MTLKIGDKVRVSTKRHGDGQCGAEGVIETVRDADYIGSLPYVVRFTGGPAQPLKTNSYAEKDLELIEDVKLKVGDRVRIKGKISGIHGDFTDATGEVVYCMDAGWREQKWAVKMDKADIALHSAGGRTPDKRGVWVKESEVEVITSITSAKFKLGDRVRIKVTADAPSNMRGQVGEVIEVDSSDSYLPYYVKADGSNEWFSDDEVTAADPVRCIVAQVRYDGVLTPSVRPYIHPSVDAAEKEALRLAAQNTGVDFAVLQVVSVAKAPKVPAPTLEKVA
jgi:hypothetical protein